MCVFVNALKVGTFVLVIHEVVLVVVPERNLCFLASDSLDVRNFFEFVLVNGPRPLFVTSDVEEISSHDLEIVVWVSWVLLDAFPVRCYRFTSDSKFLCKY